MGRPAGSTPIRKRTHGQNMSARRHKRSFATIFRRLICVAPLEMPLEHLGGLASICCAKIGMHLILAAGGKMFGMFMEKQTRFEFESQIRLHGYIS
jgi:hypothetical protein